jgi:hypothetical protein
VVQRRDFVYAVFKNELTSSSLREARGNILKLFNTRKHWGKCKLTIKKLRRSCEQDCKKGKNAMCFLMMEILVAAVEVLQIATTTI